MVLMLTLSINGVFRSLSGVVNCVPLSEAASRYRCKHKTLTSLCIKLIGHTAEVSKQNSSANMQLRTNH